jgi:hypothetical protein
MSCNRFHEWEAVHLRWLLRRLRTNTSNKLLVWPSLMTTEMRQLHDEALRQDTLRGVANPHSLALLVRWMALWQWHEIWTLAAMRAMLHAGLQVG